MSEFVMVKRELLDRAIVHIFKSEKRGQATADELRAVLAQEAGHVEEPLGMVEPTAWLLDGSVGGSSLDFQITDLLETQNRHGGCLVPLFRVPPAPVAVVSPKRCTDLRFHDEFRRGQAILQGEWIDALEAAGIKVKELNQLPYASTFRAR